MRPDKKRKMSLSADTLLTIIYFDKFLKAEKKTNQLNALLLNMVVKIPEKEMAEYVRITQHLIKEAGE